MAATTRGASALTPASDGALIGLCWDFLLLGVQVVTGTAELPRYEALKQRVRGSLDRMAAEAERSGFTAGDIDDARYALCAYLDEMIQFSAWADRDQWATSPLQVELYDEQVAGIRFFERLQRVRARSAAVTEVYYYCLVLGFGGRYRIGDLNELQQLIEALRRDLAPGRGGALSPHGLRPRGRASGERTFPLALVGAAALVLALTVAGLLLLLVSGAREEALATLSSLRG